MNEFNKKWGGCMVSHDYFRRWACQKMIEASHSNIWDGHWACAVLALIHLLEEKLVPSELESLIYQNLDKTVEEHVNSEKYRNDKAYNDCRSGLIELLIQNSGTANSLGHDVIYAYYMLDLLTRSDVPATAELYQAMKKLLEGFGESGPGYVTINGENVVIHPDGLETKVERFKLTPAIVLDLFHGFSRMPQMEKSDMQLGHILTHGHAIVQLKQAINGAGLDVLDEALFTRIDILNFANQLEAVSSSTAVSEKRWSPLEASYWEQALSDNWHGHYYKYAFSYLKLNRMAERDFADFQKFNRIL
ncbi:hypothetical protein [Paenibacillus sp. PAMC21692]|uniref:hypothetical protein n=1 Tax=Paenibacillus sp. PAMC21692 TaxID=2762320 RepID=UPI0021C2F939|nr:hypothetical protein [Paenibacillus sp. PAMC21692]